VTITIHRGTHQIGGCVTEIRTAAARVFIDFGADLNDDNPVPPPQLDGLTCGDGSQSALFFTHYHGDHIGRLSDVLPDVPVYMGETAKSLHLNLSERIRRDTARIREIHTFKPLGKVMVGDITVTPLLTDHSAFDAYMFVIDAGGKRILHTGDFRTHGPKGKGVLPALRRYAAGTDVIISEGTTLARGGEPPMTEFELKQKARELLRENKFTFVLCASTNIDRIAEFCHASREAGRLFVCDNYQKSQLEIVQEAHKSKSSFYDFGQVYAVEQLDKLPEKLESYMTDRGFCMLVRAGEKFRPYLARYAKSGTIVYSMWNGYLHGASAKKELVEFLAPYRYTTLHTSGHAAVEDLSAVYKCVNPKIGLIPIHTDAPKLFGGILPHEKIIALRDGEILNL
jgi:ribonuclease J